MDDLVAQKAAENAAMRQMVRDAAMERGPYLATDGHTLVIPSHVYHPEAARFWKSWGFQWRRDWKTWERNVKVPVCGRQYSAEAWLKSARAKYAEFWPLWQGKGS